MILNYHNIRAAVAEVREVLQKTGEYVMAITKQSMVIVNFLKLSVTDDLVGHSGQFHGPYPTYPRSVEVTPVQVYDEEYRRFGASYELWPIPDPSPFCSSMAGPVFGSDEDECPFMFRVFQSERANILPECTYRG